MPVGRVWRLSGTLAKDGSPGKGQDASLVFVEWHRRACVFPKLWDYPSQLHILETVGVSGGRGLHRAHSGSPCCFLNQVPFLHESNNILQISSWPR